MLDKNVRLGDHVTPSTRRSIIKRLLRGYGVPIDTLEAPEYAAFDPSIKVAARSGAGREAARRLRLFAGQAGQVHHPDDARLQAEGLRDDPGDRRHVAQGRHRRRHRGLRDRQALRAAHAAQARAGRVLQLGQRDRRSDHLDRLRDVRSESPHSAWHSRRSRRQDRPALGREGREEAHRRAGRPSTSYIAEQGYVLPLLQYVQPIVYKADLKVIAERRPARCSRTLVVEA